MLKDITLGQFFPGNSLIHRLDARAKIIATILYIAILFTAANIYGFSVAFVFLLTVIAISKIPIKTMIKSIRPLIFIIALTSVLNIFYTDGTPIFTIWKITATWEGLYTAVFMVLRIILLIMGTSLLTYTTSPIMLTDAIERLLSPFKKINLPVHELAMMMTIALRYIPTLIEETEKIINAQKSRGADFESGSLMRRAKALVPILVPLFVSAFRRAEELAVAMECRCYRGGEGRTRLKVMKMQGIDFMALLFMIVCLGAVIFINTL